MIIINITFKYQINDKHNTLNCNKIIIFTLINYFLFDIIKINKDFFNIHVAIELSLNPSTDIGNTIKYNRDEYILWVFKDH